MKHYSRRNLALDQARKGNCRVIFASDLHGNQQQYRHTLSYACKSEADFLIFGGDLLPKSAKLRTVEAQYRFFRSRLLPIIEENIILKNKVRPQMKIVFIYGNDDFKAVYEDIKYDLSRIDVEMISNDIIHYPDFDIIGYSYVPLTPFRYKDWEKFDFADNFQRHTSHSTHGVISTKHGLLEIDDQTIGRRSTIGQDLDHLFSKSRNPVILASHAPPRSTNLDYTYGQEHVGSEAIRRAILKYQPLISLHGHIHESAELKHHQDRLNHTQCFTTGNFFNQSIVRLIQVEIHGGKFKNYLSVIIGDHLALAKFVPTHDEMHQRSDQSLQGNERSQMPKHLRIVLAHSDI